MRSRRHPGGDTVTIADSKGDAFTAGPYIAGTKAPNSSWFFQFYETSVPGALTVTAYQTGSNPGTLQLAVQVLTGAAGNQAGAASDIYDGTTGTTSETHALTNTQSGSWLYVAVGNGDRSARPYPRGRRGQSGRGTTPTPVMTAGAGGLPQALSGHSFSA